jgi:hypothetical protein
MDIVNFILQRPAEGIVIFCIGIALGFGAGYKLRRWGYEEKIRFLEAKVERLDDEVKLWQSADVEDVDEVEDSVSYKQGDKQRQVVPRGQGQDASDGRYTEKYWLDKSPDALKCAVWYRELLARFNVIDKTVYALATINIYVGGFIRIVVGPRSNERSQITVARYEGDSAEALKILTNDGIPAILKNNGHIVFTVNLPQLKEKQSAHEWIAKHLILPKS